MDEQTLQRTLLAYAMGERAYHEGKPRTNSHLWRADQVKAWFDGYDRARALNEKTESST
jgi:hypothetical protein